MGASGTAWATGSNWSSGIAPGVSITDTAVFNNAGNGHVAIDLAGLYGLSCLTFDSPAAAAYALGSGGANSQTLVLANGGHIQLAATAGNDQTFNCAVQLGHVANAASFTIRNDNPSKTLTLNKVFAPVAGPVNTRTLNIEGAGATRILGDLQKGEASSFIVNVNGAGPFTLGGSNTLTVLYMNGTPDGVINLAAGSTNTFSNGGSGNLVAQYSTVINGPGVIRLSDAGGESYADNGAGVGKTLTINATLLGSGFEYYHSSYFGTIALNGTNLFTGQILINSTGTISVNKMGNRGATDSGLGAGTYIRMNAGNARLLYSGAGESSDRIFHFKGSPSIIEHGGSGLLKLTSTNQCDSGAKTLQLQGSTDGIGEFAGALVNGAGTLALTKAGDGTWHLSAANTCSGTTTVSGGTLTLTGAGGTLAASTAYTFSGGGTLLLDNASSANNTNRLRDASALTFSGGVLAMANDGGSADFAENAGTVSVIQGANTISVSPAAPGRKSTLRVVSLARTGGTLDFVGAGLGESDQNRLFIAGQADGLIGVWATVNGASYAAYSSANGVYAAALTVVNVAAQGPGPDSVIPDNSSADVHVTTPGLSGSDTLAGASVNSVFRLQQDCGTPSTVATASRTLKAAQVAVSAGSAGLTIGETAGDGALAPLAAGGALALRNDDATSVLTVNAAVADNSSTSSLHIYGVGKTLLAASNTYSGVTVINGGTLAFGGAVTQAVSSAIGGAGALSMEGTGRLALSGANTYTGVTTVASGTLVVQTSSALGARAAGTVIQSGATLDVMGTPGVNNSLYLDAEPVSVSGAGVNGCGAIINSYTNSQFNAFSSLALDGDTTFGGESSLARWDVRTTASGPRAYLYMNGHDITKVGSNTVGLTAATVVPGAGNIIVREGFLTAETGTDFGGSSANTMTIEGGAVFDSCKLYAPVFWRLVMKDNSRYNVRAQDNGYQNVWAGPVRLDGRAVLDAASGTATLAGDIAGAGSLVKIGVNTFRLLGSNSYAGATAVSNGTLYALTPASLPGYDDGRLTVGGGGTLAVHAAAGGVGWTADDIKDLHDASTFTAGSAVLNIDTTTAPLDIPHMLAKAVTLTKQGDNTLTFSGPFVTESPLRVNAGDVLFNGEAVHRPGAVSTLTANLTLSDSAFVYVKSNTCYIADASANTISRMTVKDHAGWSGFLYPYNVSQSMLVIGQTGRGILTLQDDACITQRLCVGNGAGSAGAVYQNGGTMVNWGGSASDARIGVTGYGYYELNSGTFTNNGYLQLGDLYAGVGILRQNAGTFEMGAVYGGQLGLSCGGTGVVYLAGGSFATSATTVDVGNSAGSASTKGYAEFTVDGTNETDVAGTVRMANRHSMFAAVNLNGGVLTANTFLRGPQTNSIALVNFDGGTFRARTSAELFGGGANAVNAINIYEGGAIFDTANFTCALSLPLRAPVGQGVAGLYVPPTTGYIGPPMVTLAGGGGTGATAIATFDSASGTFTGIQLTCPGYGYTAVPTVSLSGGGTNGFPTVTGLTLAANRGGGVTKRGCGNLLLNSTNTYTGATIVENGMLRLGLRNALPANNDIIVNGGTLDLGAFTLTNDTLTLVSGSIAGGKLVSSGVTKAGCDVFHVRASLAPTGPIIIEGGALSLRQAGLAEGSVAGAFNTSTANPRTTTAPGTRMADVGAAVWPINTTVVYSGYIWNRSAVPVTWTFAENFDESVYLKIGGTTMMTNGIAWGVPTRSTITLAPGPHAFEARFGQGTGGAGPVYGGWWKTNVFGFGVDFQGRNNTNITCYAPLRDPGDGSLLTVVASGLSATNLLDVSSVVRVDAGASLDLADCKQTLASLSGSGTVSNGQLAVTGDLAPGGAGSVGTLTVASSFAAAGRLLIDVAADGSSDHLAVDGDINLSSLVLEFANPEALDEARGYTFLTYTGTRSTSTFAAILNLPDHRWHVFYRIDGAVRLVCVNTTVLSIL